MKLSGFTLAVLSFASFLTCCSRRVHAGPGMLGGTATPGHESLQPPLLDAEKPANFPGLHNVVAFGPGLLSGSVPEGDDGFDTLRAMGVQTVVSVDGAVPALDKATARGMRYVHLPIGYGGIDRARTLELAKAVQVARERAPSAPVYVHCHHGKHRSAGAAGAVAVILGRLTSKEAVLRMKVSGTARNYSGLYRCVASVRPVDAEELAAIRSDFPAVWKTSGLVRTMVEIDVHWEHLKAVENAGWTTPRGHPDLVPAAEAGRLAYLLRNLLDDGRVKAKPAEFRTKLIEASKQARAMEDVLVQGRLSPVELSQRLKAIDASCKDCHPKYRD